MQLLRRQRRGREQAVVEHGFVTASSVGRVGRGVAVPPRRLLFKVGQFFFPPLVVALVGDVASKKDSQSTWIFFFFSVLICQRAKWNLYSERLKVRRSLR